LKSLGQIRKIDFRRRTLRLPGPGTIYLNQSLSFRHPLFIGATAQAEIVSLRADKPLATLRTMVVNQDGVLLLEGEALVLLPSQAG